MTKNADAPELEPLALRCSDVLAGTAPRVVCQFSCGAASAVATKLALAQYKPQLRTVLVVNAFIAEEHEDNRRFLADCEAWFDHPILVVSDRNYGASADEVWRRKKYMKGPHGAPCSRELKRKTIDYLLRPTDLLVFGFTAEEADRADDFAERNPGINMVAPLVERGIGKDDCLAMIERAGIELPQSYRDGFENANCIGCPKGGEGYWNKVRQVYPLVFQKRMERQESIGPGAYFFRDRSTGDRFGLKDLRPDAGRHDEPMPACSFFCELAEQEYSA